MDTTQKNAAPGRTALDTTRLYFNKIISYLAIIPLVIFAIIVLPFVMLFLRRLP